MNRELTHTQLSSAARSIPRTSPPSRLSTTSLLRTSQWSPATRIAIRTLASIRYASTAPPTTIPAAVAPPPTPTPETFSTANIDTITLDNIDLNPAPIITAIPDHVGYLHEIGINFGWGITSSLQYVMESLHVYSGLPWWGSIATTALLFRLMLLPLFLRASDTAAREAALVSVFKPVRTKMMEAQKEGNSEKQMMLWQQNGAIRKRAGLRYRDQFAPMIVQGVLGFCAFRLIRSMCALPVPGFQDGGFSWLSDLTVSDPYLILPAVMAVGMHMLVRLGGESGSMGTEAMAAQMKTIMLYILPAGVFIIMGWQPGALCVWFAVTGSLGVSQALLLKQPAVRSFFRLTPNYKPTKEEAEGMGSMSQLMEMIKPKTEQTGSKSNFVKPAPSTSKTKNTVFMRPEWQAPSSQRRAASSASSEGGAVLDVKATTRPAAIPTGANALAPAAAEAGVAQKAKGAYTNIRGAMTDSLKGWQDKTKRQESEKIARTREKRANDRAKEGKR